MERKSIVLLIALLVVGLSAISAQDAPQDEPESSFEFDLNSDGSGLIVTKYKGTARNVRIPANIQGFPVKEINGAFTGNTTITGVVIPEGVTSIGAGTFQGCSNLASVVIPRGMENIGNSAFKDCISITSLDRVASNIGADAFRNCRSLTGEWRLVNLNIGSYAFAGTGLTKITLQIGNRVIGEGAFAGCMNLQQATFHGPDRIETDGRRQRAVRISIPDNLFKGCATLETINISGIVTDIGSGAFAGCTSITSITIIPLITGIGNDAFSGCTALTTIVFDADKTSGVRVGDNAFAGCTSITSITIPEALRGRITWSSNAFSGTRLPLIAQAALKQAGYTGSF
jgi:hypothetical protein